MYVCVCVCVCVCVFVMPATLVHVTHNINRLV